MTTTMTPGYLAQQKPISPAVYERLWRKFGDEISGEQEIVTVFERLVFYLRQREAGVDAWLAKMTAAQASPRANTDREYYEGRHTLEQQFGNNPMQMYEMEQAHKQMGFKPNPNSTYEPGLARFPFDPAAYITGGRTEVRRLCEARGIACDGSVKVKSRPIENPIDPGKIAPDLVDQLIQEKVAKNPDLARVDRRDLAAEVQSQHGFTDANLVTRPTGLSPSANALLGKVLAKKAAAQKKRKK